MNRVFGKISEFALVRQDASCTAVAYDYKPEPDGENATWCEVIINRLHPSFSEVKDAIIRDVNARTTARIISGFTYTVKHGAQAGTEVNVWLSSANQQDFHAMHQNSADIEFPVRYKVGEIDGTPVYEEFANVEEMHAICVSTTNHVLACQQAGWAEKDAIDWTPYEEALDPEVE